MKTRILTDGGDIEDEDEDDKIVSPSSSSSSSSSDIAATPPRAFGFGLEYDPMSTYYFAEPFYYVHRRLLVSMSSACSFQPEHQQKQGNPAPANRSIKHKELKKKKQRLENIHVSRLCQ
jgi:hypothetical protein